MDINKILESNFKKLDEVFAIFEGKQILSQYGEQRNTPDYLYLELERLLRSPKIGIYLSPAQWLQKRSAFVLDRFESKKNGLIERNEAEIRAGGLSMDEIEEQAMEEAEAEIKTEIEEKRRELRQKHTTLTNSQIDALVRRELPLHTNMPSWEEMSVDSQTAGHQEVFANSNSYLKGSEVPLDQLVASSYVDKNNQKEYLEAMRRIVIQRNVDPTWHDVDISKMVVFESGTSVPPRIRAKAAELDRNIENAEKDINELRTKDDAVSIAQAEDREAELEYYTHKKEKLTVGAWRPDDLNELVYGSKTPITPESAYGDHNTGLIPDLCYVIGAMKEKEIIKPVKVYGHQVGTESKEVRAFYESVIDEHIDAIRRSKKSADDQKEEIKKWEEFDSNDELVGGYRKIWLDSNGDLSKAPQELYVMAVQYIMGRIPNVRRRLESILQKEKDENKVEKILDILNVTEGMVSSDVDDKNVIIGNTKYTERNTKSGSKWNKGKNVLDPRDKTRELPNLMAIYDANLEDGYNSSSVMKRVTVAQMVSEAIDRAVYQWVLNKVGDDVVSLQDPTNKSVGNIGSDPNVINHFVSSID